MSALPRVLSVAGSCDLPQCLSFAGELAEGVAVVDRALPEPQAGMPNDKCVGAHQFERLCVHVGADPQARLTAPDRVVGPLDLDERSSHEHGRVENGCGKVGAR